MDWREKHQLEKQQAELMMDLHATELGITTDQLVDILLLKMRERRNG